MNGYLLGSVGLIILCHFANGRQGEPTWIALFGAACALAGYGACVALAGRKAKK